MKMDHHCPVRRRAADKNFPGEREAGVMPIAGLPWHEEVDEGLETECATQ